MASANLCATLFLFSLVLSITISVSCGPCEPKVKPMPMPKPKPKPKSKLPAPMPQCPRDTLKLGGCADLLGGTANVILGTPLSSQCCSLLTDLTDVEAAVCLCTAIKANVLGMNLDIPVALSVLVSSCKKTIPYGFKCA